MTDKATADSKPAYTRTPVNPVSWATEYYNQGEVISGATKTLRIAGQVSVVPDPGSEWGVKPSRAGDMRDQMAGALAALDEVLKAAGMRRENLAHMQFFVTDMQAGLGAVDILMEWLGPCRPPQSFIGVSELFMDGLVIEIEGSAVA
ncbi:RidA family protein [Roseobacter sp.]|uniref:RidA family protein n=1 Tax=Roseobacter sp. TaxID=1907202 RepID=UPI0025DC3CCF|nr:RidA family protein [Roseobacter sp.]